MYTSSHLILGFITSYFRQALCKKIDQHLLIFVSTPETQSGFSLSPGVSLSPPPLREPSMDFFPEHTPALCKPGPNYCMAQQGLYDGAHAVSPARKTGWLGDFSGRVAPLLELADLLSLLGFESLAL